MLKKCFYGLAIAVLAVSLIVSGVVGYFLVSNQDNVGKAIKIFGLIKTQSLEPVATGDLLLGVVNGMVGSLDDPYSVYLDERTYEDLTERMQGTYGGVGLLITMDQDGNLIVVSPFRGTPAHEAGIASGDKILKINGEDTSKIDLEAAAALMQGDPGTEVSVTTYRPGRGELDLVLKREMITIPSVDGTVIPGAEDIAYVAVSMFNDNTGEELVKFVEGLKQQGFKAMVLDLRNNPGGSLHAAIEVADYFIAEGPIVHIASKRNTHTYNATDAAIGMPLAVLVNSGSASASEIVAGAIQDTGVGVLVGEKTFGKGLVQSVLPLGDGAALKLTTAKYLTPDSRDINDTGIEPDYTIGLTPEELAHALLEAPSLEHDLQLQKAVTLLKSKL